MNILLINDATFKNILRENHRVIAAGAEGACCLMPSQGDFDVTFPAHPIMHIDEILRRLPRGFAPELVIHFETHNNYFYLGVEQLPCPVVWRTIDNHMHTWQPRYAVLYDMTFVAQKDYCDAFRQHAPSRWLPLHCFPAVHFDRRMERDLDVSFVGSMNRTLKPKRVEFVEALRKRIPLHVFENIGQEEMAVIYNRSKIVLNECMNNDVNYRIFEALADGALLLTPRAGNGLEDLFQDGEHLVMYRPYDVDDVVEKCAMLLSEHPRYRVIAQRGNELVMRKHTLAHRVDELMSAVESMLPSYHQERARRITLSAYAGIVPIMAALHTKGFADFSGTAYMLDEMKKLDHGRALQSAEQLLDGILAGPLHPIASAISAWIAVNR